ncbi:rossman fold oxidoreductase [Cryptococcus wingfieldii CBS 7118]|uniref:Rossman fold oxidoreductase n=1 Tax=Cryptococcus wingfieldii CBS 7118 TaxID=1295528 RepID=A0A1E3JBX2_9TREE|nr:rossman fold oxidoreductase [Cryptococcus wingfieldii CBS 7118]ODN97411.1 rossman fold oxidoreductase [Cryptococcus wingfieldii CBS 7118]
MSVAVVQGASGGLGASLTRHILRHTNLSVYALTQQPSASRLEDTILDFLPSGVGDKGKLSTSERLTVVDSVDIREEDGLERAKGLVKEREGEGSVRLVVCLAGILKAEKSLAGINLQDALNSFQINTLGHLMTYKHFVPLIPSKKAFKELKGGWGEEGDPAKGLMGSGHSICCSLSARVGSIGDNERGGWYSYRASKAAVNQIIRTLDHELINKSSSGIAYGYHPGTVLTPFTAPIIGNPSPDASQGRFDVDQAIVHLTDVMGKVQRGAEGEEGEWGGRCWDWKGKRIEW